MSELLMPLKRAKELKAPGVGRKTFAELCRDAGAMVVYGRNRYVNIPKLQAYIDSVSGGNDHGSVSTLQGNEAEEG